MRNLSFSLLFVCALCYGISPAQNQRTIDSLSIVLLNIDNDKSEIEIHLSLSDLLLNIHTDESFEHANKAYLIAKKNNHTKSIAICLNKMAKINLRQLKLKPALNNASSSLEIAEENNHAEEKIESMLTIGFVYNTLGEFDRSSAYFIDCLQQSEGINNDILISKSFTGIGYTYFLQHNYDKAMEYYLKSLSKAREAKYASGISISLNNIAAVYGRLDKPEKLLPYLKKSIDINKSEGNQQHLATNYSNLAAYYFGKGKNDSSFYYLGKALHIAESIQNPEMISHVNYSIAYQLFLKGNYQESLKKVLLALDFSQQYELKNRIYSSAVLLDSIYKKTGDYKQAYHYKTIASKIKDRLDLDDNITELSKLELIYELDKKEREQAARQNLIELAYLLGSIILMLALGFVLLLLKRNQLKAKAASLQKQNLENELEFKNKELTSNVISLMKKNEMLNKFSTQLLEIRNNVLKDETKASIYKISKELKQSIESEIWVEFEARFKEVHSEFYRKLMMTYPNLSPNEQRLSAFLRLNMSTKEISGLTGQSISAIEMGRFRLRKKLNISGSDENLITFLSHI